MVANGRERIASIDDLTLSLEDLRCTISSGHFPGLNLDEKSLENLKLLYGFLNHGVSDSKIHNQVFGYILGKVHNYQDSEDIMSEVKTVVLEKWYSYDPKRGLMPWLFTVVSNKITDHQKRNRRWTNRIPFFYETNDDSANRDDVGDFFCDPEDSCKTSLDELTENEERSAVGNYVNRLPGLLKQIISLVYFQGLKFSRIKI